MKTKTNFKHLGGASFWALLLLMLLCGNNTFANHWKGVPFVLNDNQAAWGNYYYGDDKNEPTRAYSTFTICDDNSTNIYMPLYNGDVGSHYVTTQMIIPASVLDGHENSVLKSLTIYKSNRNLAGVNYKIYMQQVSDASYTASVTNGTEFAAALKPYSGEVCVYNGTIANNATIKLVFSNDYTYRDGNLCITFISTSQGSPTDAALFYGKVYANGGIYGGSTTSTFNSYYTGGKANFIPKMTFEYEPAICEAPVFNYPEGEYNAPLYVEMSSNTDGASIYYTTNGSTPTTSSSEYTTPLYITQQTTLKAIAAKTGVPESVVTSASYTFRPQVVASPGAGVYTSAQNVALSAPSCPGNVSIYYTTDGSTPTTNSSVYSTPITVSSEMTIKAIAVTDATGWNTTSGILEANYRFIDGGPLTIDDRISHDLEYYGSTSLVNSTDPIDVTITYNGNGGLLGLDAPVDVLTYQKTIEKDLDGNYYFNLIPSFSLRPSGKAFLGWKLTSISGGSIDGYSVGATIPANTDLTFATVSDGMTINFEAQWGGSIHVYHATTAPLLREAIAAATAADHGLDPAGTIETNFVVGSRDVFSSAWDVTNQIPVTITHVDPITLEDYRDTDPTARVSCDSIDLRNDMRFEYVTMCDVRKIRANGNNLSFGRGVELYASSANGYCAKVISATSTRIKTATSTSNVLDCRLIVETGVFDSCYVMSSEVYSTSDHVPYVLTYTSNNNKVTALFGNDYDRSQADNNSLVISGMASLTNSYKFTGTGNAFNVTVKSGTFSSTAGTNEPFYFGFRNGGSSLGKRRVVIEGGVFDRGISGGIDSNVSSDEAFTFRMTDGIVNGPIYGAGTYSSAAGMRRMVITGGSIKGWVAGGCNGTRTTGGLLDGDTYIYIGGNAVVSSNGSSTTYGSSEGGYVFGAGCGIEGGTTVGRVNNSTIVIADDATVEHDIYGGGNYGYVVTGGTSNIQILGGSIGGSVFGGSNQQDGSNINISMIDGVVSGSVYGGSNSTGTINGTVDVAINGGVVNGDVYGAGFGVGTEALGKLAVNINGGTVRGNVFGGGANGKSGPTTVNINGGVVDGNAFAGALGTSDPLVMGNKTLNMNGGTVRGNVYGGSRNANDGHYGTGEVVSTQVGTGTSATATHAPFGTYGLSKYSWAEIIYPASTLEAGQIKSVSFYCSSKNKHTSQSLKIYLAHRSSGKFSGTTDWTPEADLNLVYSHQGVVIGESTGWQKFDFDAPFEYNGTDNLVVIVVRDGSTIDFTSNGPAYYCTDVSTTNYPTLYRHDNNSTTINYSTAPGTQNRYRANTKFDIVPSSAYAGTGTKTGYNFGMMPGKGANVYGESFYYPYELLTAGTITSVSYEVGTALSGGLACSELKIFMGHTTKEAHDGNTDWTPIENLTLVYSRENTNVGSKVGWEEFELDTPFTYNGVDNLVVVVSRKSSSSNTTLQYKYTSTGIDKVNLYKGGSSSDYAEYNPEIAGSISDDGNRANVRFKFGASSSFVNISGGTVTNNVYGGGYYGHIMGNTYVNIGKNAIENSPCAAANTNKPATVTAGSINIGGSVYSGSDWGEMAGSTGFGASNITGHTDIYIDGTGHSSINAGTALYGAGTSSYAGAAGSNIYVRNYGTSGAKSFTTIQHASDLVIDNSNLNLTGAGDQEQNNVSEPYAVRRVVNEMRLANGSTISINAPIEQVANLGSYTCANIYAGTPTYTATTYSAPGNTINMTPGETGHYINVVDTTAAATYGAVKGYFYFGGTLESGTSFAYARQKQSVSSPCYDSDHENPGDGGFVSTNIEYNSYDASGQEGTGSPVQICYINHPQGSKDPNYYREWVLRTATMGSEVEGTLIAAVDRSTADTLITTSTTMMIPSAEGSYFVLTDIDFGDEAGLVETGQYLGGAGKYAYRSGSTFNYNGVVGTTGAVDAALALMDEDFNTRFGLTMTPKSGVGSADLTTWIINADALEQYHSGKKIYLPANPEEVLTVDFTLTYSNKIDMNAELAPVTLTLTEYNSSNAEVNKVYVKLNIVTKTSVLQDTEIDVYITQNGNGNAVETSVASLLLPPFVMTGDGTCHFTVTDIDVTDLSGDFDASLCSDEVEDAGLNKVAVQYGAIPNSDQTNHWTGTQYTGSASYENCSFGTSQILGAEDGRFASTIGFIVSYDGTATSLSDAKIGKVKYTITLDNYSELDAEDNPDSDFTVTLNIYRRSKVQNWYLSHKGNSFNSGKFPDEPKKSMYNVLNSGYATGDNVFIVDTVRVSSQQEWDGLSYGGINIYRYTGSHKNHDASTDAAVAYTGTLVHVLDGGNLQMSGVTIDGMATGSPSYAVEGINLNTSYTAENGVPSVGPAILVDDDSRIEFFDGTIAYNNNTLNHNVETVGGVKMLGSMTIGGDVQINNNMAHGIEGNIYLPSYGKYLEVSSEGLNAEAFIGITKLDFDGNAFTPIANSTAAKAQAAYTNDNFFADNGIGQLYYDNVDNATNNTQKEKDYLAMSWVSHVQTAPGSFNIENIDSKEELAWAISYVNGYNGQEAHPGTNITITADLNMNDFIWVPIGDRYSPYAGTFTGNAKVIDSIHSGINHIGAKGLFGYTNGATINGAFVKNGELEMTDVNAYVGGIVGNANETTIDFCQSGLEATADNGYAGGLVGRMANSTVVNSMAVGEVSGNIAGGVAGYTTASSEDVEHSAIENTFVNANVEGLAYTGGIAGYNQIDLTNNYVHANTTITGDNAGMLVGHNQMSLASGSAGSITKNDGTITNLYVPVNRFVRNARQQFIQPSTDLTGLIGNKITSVTFYSSHETVSWGATVEYKVRLMEVAQTTFGSNSFVSLANDTIVYDGTVSISGKQMVITFTTPYVYGGGDLLFDFTHVTGGSDADPYFYGINTTGYSAIERHGVNNTITRVTFLPKMTLTYEPTSAGSATTGITKCYYAQGTTLPLAKTNDGADTDVISNCNYFTPTAAYDYANQGGNRVGATTTRLAAQMNTATGYLPWAYTTASDINGDMPVLSNTDFTCMGQADGTRFIDYGTDVNNLIALYNANDGGGAINLTANADIIRLPESDVTLYINEDVAVTQSVSGSINAYTGITMKNEGTLGTKNRTWHFFSSPLTAAPMGLTYENEGTIYNPYGSTPEDGETVYPYLGNVNSAVNGYIPNDMGYTAEGGSVTSNGTYMDFDLYSYCEPDYHWINLKRNSNSHFHEDEPHAQITYTNETTFTPGKGYMFALGDNSSHSQVFVQSNGVLNNSNSISLPISRSGAHLTGYNFLGNPYQSYLDFEAFSTNANNRDIWSESGHVGYIIYDAVQGGYVSFGYDPSGIYPSQGAIAAGPYINMHQGFMVISDGSATQAVFDNSMRDITPNATHFRGEQPTFPVVNLIATDADGKKDFTVVEVNRPSNGGVRKLTGIRNGNAMMYAHYDNANLGLAFIEGTPEYVPLWFEAQEDGIYTLTWNTANFDLGYMHLVDNLTGADYDMLSNDQYTFQSNRTDSKARFRLVFKPMGIEEEVESETGENFAFIDNNGQLIVNGEGELSFIDLNGRILMTEYVSGQQNHISMPKVAVGMYMLRLSSVNGTKVQKIVVRK